MTNFIVIEKDSLNKSTVNATQITLTEASIVHTKMSRDDVDEFIRDGNNLVLKLKNGEVVVIENFFITYDDVASDLVFEEDGCVLYWFDGVSGFKGIPGLEALLPAVESSQLVGLLPWLVGAAVVGGAAAIIDHNDKDDKKTDVPVTPAPNQAPEANNDLVTPVHNAPVTKDILENDSDPENDPLTVKDFTVDGTKYQPGETATIPNVGTITITEEGVLTFEPVTDYVGEVPPVEYTVTDGEKDSTATVTIEDVPAAPNQAPVAENDTVTPVHNGPVTKDILENDSDPENDPLTVKDFTVDGTKYQPGETATIPNVGTITITEEGVLTFEPVTDYVGEVPPVEYTVTDGEKDSTATVTIEDVPAAPNQAPVAENDTVTPVHNGPVTKDILENDSDPENDPLTVKDFTVDGTKYQPGETATIPNVGTITITEEGVLTFEPVTDYVGEVPPVEYTVTDGEKDSTATVTIEDVPAAPNQAPVAENDTVTPVHNGPVTKDILENDSDPENDPLTVKDFTVDGTKYQPGETATIPNVGTITITEEGVLTFEPVTDYVGEVPPVEYTVTDGEKDSTATVTIEDVPAAPNQAPVAENDTVTPVHNGPVTKDILENDSDPENDPLTVKDFTVDGTKYQPGETATIPNVGTITITEEGVLTFEPVTDYVGEVPPVEYTVTDGEKDSTATVTIEDVPAAPNQAPVAENDTVTPVHNGPVTKDILENDSDPENDPLTVKDFTVDGTKYQPGETATIPNVGTITITEEGVLTFEPVTDYVGEVPPVEYTVTDGEKDSTATVTIEDVPAAPNQAPVAENDTVTPVHNGPVTKDILENDSDPENDPLTVKDFTVDGTKYQPGETATIPNVGTITITEEGVLTFEPVTDYVGEVPPVEYTVTDGEKDSTATVTIEDVPAAPNQAPVAENDTVTPVHNGPVTKDILENDSDPENDPLTVKDFTVDGTKYQPGETATIPNVGTITITEEGVLTFEPVTDYVGEVPPVEYTVTDGEKDSTATVTIEDVPAAPNQAPVAENDTVTPVHNGPVTKDILENDSDPENDPLTVKDFTVDGTKYQPGETATIPNVGTITITEEGVLTFEPVTDYVGEVPPVEYTVTDGEKDSTATVTIEDVPAAPNQAPVAENDTVTPVHNGPVTKDILENDSDPENDPLTVKDFTVDGTKYQPGETATIPNVGTITITEEGVLTFEPVTDYVGEVPPVEYTVTDGEKDSTATVTIEDVPAAPNQAPVAENDTVTPVHNGPVTKDILENDSDPENDPLTVKDFTVDGTKYQPGETATIPNVGTITITEEGVLTFEPVTDYVGEVPPVEYTVTDGEKDSTATVTIEDVPAAPNQAPVAENDTVTPVHNGPVTKDILENDSDPENDPLTVKDFTVDGTKYQPGETATIPNVGTITITEEGVLTFEPVTDYVGEVPPVEYTVTDGEKDSTATVTIEDVPAAPNQAPVAENDTVTPVHNGPVTKDILENDSDPENDPLTVKDFTVDGTKYQPGETATIPNVGTITITEEGVLTFEPVTDYVGEVPPVEYTVTDGEKDSTATVTIEDVPAAPNQAPVAENDTVTPVHNGPVTKDILENDSDPENDPLTVKDFTVDGTKYQPGETATIPNVGTITITEEGVLTFEPVTDYVGEVPPVEYTVTDGEKDSTATVTIEDVPAAPNQAPVAENDTVTPVHNGPVTKDILENDSDPENDPLTVKDFTVDGTKYQPGETATIPNVGTITITEEGVLTFEPVTDYVGEVPPVEYTVTDGEKDSTATVTIEDVPAAPNQAPVAENDTVTPVHNGPVTKDILENDSDPENDPLTVKDFTVDGTKYQPGETATIPNVGTITITEEGVLTFEPVTDYVGEVPPVEYTVTDGEKDSTATVTIEDVPAAPNQAPVAENDTVTPVHNGPVTKDILENDSDPENDPLTVKDFTVDGTKYQPGETATIPNVGTITITEEGVLTFEPVTDYVGEVPPVEYTVTDGEKDSTATVTIEDVPAAPNQAPVAENDTVTPVHNGPVTKDILENDSDPENDPLTVKDFTVDGTKYQPGETATIPNVGTITITEEGVLTFEPVTDYVGEVPPVEYTVTDGEKDSTATVTIEDVPAAPNQAPVAENDTVTPVHNGPVTKDILENDSDPENDPLTVKDFTVDGTKYQPGETATIPNVGTITITEEGVLTFEPVTDYVGEVPPVEYTVTDGEKDSTATVTIEDVPAAPNQAPVAENDTVTPVHNGPVTKDILENDSDPENDPLTVKDFTVDGTKYQPGETATIPNVGTITITEEGVLTFEPVTDYVGEVPPVEYTVTDGEKDSTATVTFNDVPVKPDATVLEDGKVTLPNPIEGQPANILINTVTIGGVTTPITHDWNSVVKNPIEVPGVGTLTVTSTGELTFTPVKDFSGMVEIPEITYAYGYTGETITTDAINVQVTAVADQPMVGIFNFDIPPLELNIQTWKNVKNVDGRNLIENAGDGANRDTLINAIDYLRNNTNVTNSDGSIIANAEAGMTGSLNASNLPTFDAVYIHGFVFLEAGQVYKYEGKADDSAAIIIGDGVSTEHVNWKGVNTEADTSFSVSQTGFYSFQFYAHNADGMGNYNFNVTTEDGSAVSYYPSVDAINGLLTDTGYILGDYDVGVDGKDETGFYPIALGYQGNAEDVIQLDGIHVKAMDIDGSEYVSFEMSGLRPGSILSFKDASGKSHSVTVGADGIAKYSPAVQDASASEYTDFTLTVKEKSQEILDVTLTATSTEISNSDKTTSTLDFQVKVLDADGFAGRSMLTADIVDEGDLTTDEDSIFKVLNQEYALADGEANQVDGFTIGSNDQIDISSLLSADATESNLAEFISVDYDAENKQAVISIDRDGAAEQYQSEQLVVLLNQQEAFKLEDLVQHNQIIIG